MKYPKGVKDRQLMLATGSYYWIILIRILRDIDLRKVLRIMSCPCDRLYISYHGQWYQVYQRNHDLSKMKEEKGRNRFDLQLFERFWWDSPSCIMVYGSHSMGLLVSS